MSLPEVLLWGCLRGERLQGLRVRRQHAIGSYILDFYCPSARLAVEVDGEFHGEADQARHDAVRTRWLHEEGIQVLRIAARDVLDEKTRPDVLDAIVHAAAPSTPTGSPSPMNGGG
ncbi:endonuclease domain-containing protein [Brevundimonas poindexterae]|uniref:endonuclease domain-containing protein n=1 Tax=Brevundimonas poindexterae TaxID=74325 RepID=UPI0021F62315|nr:endonuclease domain-containing protein [Brevundimonas poindexterae]